MAFSKGLIISLLFLFPVTISCMREKANPDYSGFPYEVGKIIVTHCAVSGCHEAISKEACSGLDLSSWNSMFEGNRSGAVVVPFRSDYSPLFFSCNIYSELGIQTLPTMPINSSPLSKEQILTLKNWIDEGAPDLNRKIKFADHPNRKKIYIANQGCDVVSVVDAETNLIMRCIDVGNKTDIEYPHMIKVSPDGMYWYVFFGSGLLQKYRTNDDTFVGEVPLGASLSHYWNTFVISADSKSAFCIGGLGTIANINLQLMSVEDTYSGFAANPYSVALSSLNDTVLYVTAKAGTNYIYKVFLNDPLNPELISLQTSIAPSMNPSQPLDPYDIVFSPDGSKYFVSCPRTNEVRVMNTDNDSLISTIAVGIVPQNLSISKTTNRLFASCTDDTLSFPGKRGSVSVIDYTNNILVKKIHSGFQPYGMAVDDAKKILYVANRNTNQNGPAPHHSGKCGGRNGYVTLFDINLLELVSGEKTEVSIDPYSIAIRE